MCGARSSGQQLRLLALLPIERQGPWLDACLLCGGGDDLRLTQVNSPHEAAAALRQHSFDLLVFWHEGGRRELLEGWDQLSQLTDHEGFVALGMQAEEGWNEPLIDAGAIVCLDMDQTDPLTLVHTLRNSAELERLRSQSQLWELERQRRHERETREIDRALAGQRSLLERLDQLGSGPLPTTEEEQQRDVPETILLGDLDPLASEEGQYYLVALQSFIFDESPRASTAVASLAEHFARLGSTSSAIMRVHLSAVTRITAGGGAGSLRHCLAGADRFLMELLMRTIDQQSSIQSPVCTSVRLRSLTSPLAAA